MDKAFNNPLELKVNQRVIVDKGKPNSSEVIIQYLTPNEMFATVKADDGYEWQTRTGRLSKIQTQ